MLRSPPFARRAPGTPEAELVLDFSLTDDQKALATSARSFARDVVAPRVPHMDETNEYPPDLVDALAAQGFMGLTLPPE